MPEVEVVAICDTNKKKLESVSRHFCIADTYTEYNQLIKREDNVHIYEERDIPVLVGGLPIRRNQAVVLLSILASMSWI